MKKILSFIIALMMMVTMASGCNKEPDDVVVEGEGENAIVVEAVNKYLTAVVYDRGEDEPADKEYWENVVDSFEKANQGVTVNLVFTKDAAYEVRDRILSGNSPDFVFLPSGEENGVTEALIKDRAMLPLTDVEASAPAGIFENGTCKPYDDGVSYIAPVLFETKGLIFNTELLSSNGFSNPQTWDDFVSIAKACENKKFAFFTYSGAEPDEFADIFAAALVPAIGAEEMGKILSYDEEAWKNESIKTFIDKIEEIKSLVVSKSTTKTRDDVIECLKNGEVLFISGTEADLEELNKDGEKYAICKYPALSGSPVATVSFSEMYIPVEAKEPELAKDFMKHIYMDMSSSSTYSPEVFAGEFAVKNGANETLSDEFCGHIVDVFKSMADADEFVDQMLVYIEEF